MREREVVGLPAGKFGKGRKINFWDCTHNTKKPWSCQNGPSKSRGECKHKTALTSLFFSSTSPKYQVSSAQWRFRWFLKIPKPTLETSLGLLIGDQERGSNFTILTCEFQTPKYQVSSAQWHFRQLLKIAFTSLLFSSTSLKYQVSLAQWRFRFLFSSTSLKYQVALAQRCFFQLNFTKISSFMGSLGQLFRSTSPKYQVSLAQGCFEQLVWRNMCFGRPTSLCSSAQQQHIRIDFKKLTTSKQIQKMTREQPPQAQQQNKP